jgi:hypothetical protein
MITEGRDLLDAFIEPAYARTRRPSPELVVWPATVRRCVPRGRAPRRRCGLIGWLVGRTVPFRGEALRWVSYP